MKEADHWDFISKYHENLGKKYVPKNTAATIKWVLTNFNTWKEGRSKCFATDPDKCIPDDILDTTNSTVLCKWRTVYIAKTRKQDPKMLSELHR